MLRNKIEILYIKFINCEYEHMSGPIGFLLKMNPLSYYNKLHLPWTSEELTLIKQQYNEQGMDVIQIGNIHYKTPGQVSYRLKQIGAVDKMSNDIRGYKEYRESSLFQEVQNNSDTFKKELMQQDKGSMLRTTRQERRQERRQQIQQTNTTQQDTIEQLSAEIQMIKNDVKEILRLMNALYDFESQQQQQ